MTNLDISKSSSLKLSNVQVLLRQINHVQVFFINSSFFIGQDDTWFLQKIFNKPGKNDRKLDYKE